MEFIDPLRTEVVNLGINVTPPLVPGFIRTNTGVNALTGSAKPAAKQDPDIETGMAATECAVSVCGP